MDKVLIKELQELEHINQVLLYQVQINKNRIAEIDKELCKLKEQVNDGQK
jgi:hypothetical protein